VTTLRAWVAVLALLGLAACDTGDDGYSDDDWDPDAQFAPSLRPVAGVRESAGDLLIWTGAPCTRVSRVTVTFDQGGEEAATWELTARRPRDAEVEHLALHGRNPGLRTTRALPAGFDWQEAATVSLVVERRGTSWGTTTDLDVVREESDDHPTDEYYFDHVGWLDRAAVRAGDGKDFLTTCAPDPAR
jgi:hypothetical protein